MKMKTWMIAMATSLALCGQAFASGPELRAFLQNMEGTWRGDGTSRVDHSDGRRSETYFDLEVRVRYRGGDNWEVRNVRRTARGPIERGSFVFGVRGDRLLAGPTRPTEPVELVEVSEDTLVYRIYRFDSRTGQVYRLTYDTRIIEGFPDRNGNPTRYIDGFNQAELNGNVVAEDHFTLD